MTLRPLDRKQEARLEIARQSARRRSRPEVRSSFGQGGPRTGGRPGRKPIIAATAVKTADVAVAVGVVAAQLHGARDVGAGLSWGSACRRTARARCRRRTSRCRRRAAPRRTGSERRSATCPASGPAWAWASSREMDRHRLAGVGVDEQPVHRRILRVGEHGRRRSVRIGVGIDEGAGQRAAVEHVVGR